MPFYVFSCPSCDLLLDYWSKRATSAVPACPHCGGPLDREVQAFHAGRGGADADCGDGLGGGFVDPERAAAAGEGFDARLEAARRRGGAAAVAGEIAATAAAAGIAIDPEWREAASKAAAGDESSYDALVDSGVAPLASDSSRAAKVPDPRSAGASENGGAGVAARAPRRRDPVLREIPAPPLPPRKPSPWDGF